MKWCVEFPEETILVVRPSLDAICLDIKPAAKLLSELLYRCSIRKEHQQDAQNMNDLASEQGQEATQDTTLRIYRTQAQLVGNMIHEMTEKTLHKVAVPALLLLGYIDLEEYLSMNCYIVHIDRVREALLAYRQGDRQLDEYIRSHIQLELFPIDIQLENFPIDRKKFLLQLEKVLIAIRKSSNLKRGRKPRSEETGEPQSEEPQINLEIDSKIGNREESIVTFCVSKSDAHAYHCHFCNDWSDLLFIWNNYTACRTCFEHFKKTLDETGVDLGEKNDMPTATIHDLEIMRKRKTEPRIPAIRLTTETPYHIASSGYEKGLEEEEAPTEKRAAITLSLSQHTEHTPAVSVPLSLAVEPQLGGQDDAGDRQALSSSGVSNTPAVSVGATAGDSPPTGTEARQAGTGSKKPKRTRNSVTQETAPAFVLSEQEQAFWTLWCAVWFNAEITPDLTETAYKHVVKLAPYITTNEQLTSLIDYTRQDLADSQHIKRKMVQLGNMVHCYAGWKQAQQQPAQNISKNGTDLNHYGLQALLARQQKAM